MSLAKKLISTPQRENSGGRTSNRYSYQHMWAFNHILDRVASDEDFMLIMEFHDDVFVIDSASNPQYIDFYQIKTDNKPSRYLTPSFITKDAKQYPEKMSIAQKLIGNYCKFDSETRSIHLVSNKHYDFGNLKDEINSTERNVIKLYEINDKSFLKIKNGMCAACKCNECGYEDGCNFICMYLLQFDVSSLDLVNYEDTVLGRFIKFLSNSGIESGITHTKSIFYTILSEIKRINNSETVVSSFEQLLKMKSMTKQGFLNLIDQLRRDSPDNMWDEVRSYLLHDGFSTLEVSKIGHQWKKYQLDSMDVDDLLLVEIRDDIQKIISIKTFDNSKEYTQYIYNQLKGKSYFKIYIKEYLYAIIVKELFL